MKFLILCIVLTLFPTLLWSASLSDVSGMLSFPLQWTQRSIDLRTASTCVVNVDQSTWILGGKAIGVSNDISNTAKKQQYSKDGYYTIFTDQTMLVPGYFPGQYVNSPGMYCTLSAQVAYGTYNGVTKMCYLSANDGTSNNPQCGCCDMDIDPKNGNKIRCDDLDNLDLCPPIFSSCIVNDFARNRALQFGGNTGTMAANNTLCFDISKQRYTSDVNTISRLNQETAKMDPYCEYGNLAAPAFDVGCDLMPNDLTRAVVVVGGRTIYKFGDLRNNFLDTVQICKNNYKDCEVLPIKLEKPASQVRVLGLTSCIFMTFGGITVDGILGDIYVGDICGKQWLYKQSLPASLSEFSLVVGYNTLCLYGGIVNFQLQNTAYCTNFNPPKIPTTPRPTARPTRRPSKRPTRRPTSAPTVRPVAPGEGRPDFYQGWSVAYQWDTGRESQGCYSNDQYLFVLGGKNSGQKILNTLSAFDSQYRKWEFQMYQYNPLISSQTLTFYCPNSCVGGYQNRIYLVNPLTDDGSTAARLFECVVDMNSDRTTCVDLCDSKYGVLPYCSSVLFWDACVTTQGQHLYIVGGRDRTSRRDSITVFDMVKRDWASVPRGSPAASKYPIIYGSLSIPVTNHACAVWDSDVYTFGGQTNSNSVTGAIQKCDYNDNMCTLKNAVLNVPRYYATASSIGSTIVILCGARDSQTLTNVVELYDILLDSIKVDYTGNTRGLLLDTAKCSCCVSRWDSKNSLVVTGGVTTDGSQKRSVSSMSSAVFSIQEESSDGKPLYECGNIQLQSTNKNFVGTFKYYSKIQQYLIWLANGYDAVIYFEEGRSDYTWIGNLTSQIWAYSPSAGFTSDYWMVLTSRSIYPEATYFSFTCLDNQRYTDDSSKNTRILGLSPVIFYVILGIVILVLLLLTALIYYWIKRYKHLNREITIQSSSYGSMRKILQKQSSSSIPEKTDELPVSSDDLNQKKAEEENTISHSSDSVNKTTTNDLTGDKSFKQESQEQGARDEQLPLTNSEIQAVEHGGIHIGGYHGAIVNIDDADNDTDSLSSVEPQGVQFQDHKIFKKTAMATDVTQTTKD